MSSQTHSKMPKASFCGFLWAAAKLTSYVWNLAKQWALTQFSAPRENFPNRSEYMWRLVWRWFVACEALDPDWCYLLAACITGFISVEGKRVRSDNMKSSSAPPVISFVSHCLKPAPNQNDTLKSTTDLMIEFRTTMAGWVRLICCIPTGEIITSIQSASHPFFEWIHP